MYKIMYVYFCIFIRTHEQQKREFGIQHAQVLPFRYRPRQSPAKKKKNKKSTRSDNFYIRLVLRQLTFGRITVRDYVSNLNPRCLIRLKYDPGPGPG